MAGSRRQRVVMSRDSSSNLESNLANLVPAVNAAISTTWMVLASA